MRTCSRSEWEKLFIDAIIGHLLINLKLPCCTTSMNEWNARLASKFVFCFHFFVSLLQSSVNEQLACGCERIIKKALRASHSRLNEIKIFSDCLMDGSNYVIITQRKIFNSLLSRWHKIRKTFEILKRCCWCKARRERPFELLIAFSHFTGVLFSSHLFYLFVRT
jgi:hypothetical protein